MHMFSLGALSITASLFNARIILPFAAAKDRILQQNTIKTENIVKLPSMNTFLCVFHNKITSICP